MKYYLENINTEQIEYSYDTFNEERIKRDLTEYLTDNSIEELWFYKVNGLSELVGDDLISVFVLKGGSICKELLKGNRTFYKKIEL